MSESTGSPQPPEWYTKPPAWLTDPPQQRRGRDIRYGADDDDDRGYRRPRRDRDDEDLVTAIRAMPEQVVSALREAIQGAQQSQQQNNSGQQQQQQDPPKESTKEDDKPAEQLTWGERFLMNKL